MRDNPGFSHYIRTVNIWPGFFDLKVENSHGESSTEKDEGDFLNITVWFVELMIFFLFFYGGKIIQ